MKNNRLKIYVDITRKLASNTFHILLRYFGTKQTHTSHCIQICMHPDICRHIPITAFCAFYFSLKM